MGEKTNTARLDHTQIELEKGRGRAPWKGRAMLGLRDVSLGQRVINALPLPKCGCGIGNSIEHRLVACSR